jgi:PAS domain S-box-containing protein
MPDVKILIVEDNPTVAEDIKNRLMHRGYRSIAIANTAAQALDAAKEHGPDIALMDIHLGDKMIGIDTAMALKTRYQVPVIFITAFADEDTVERAKVTEPYGYIVKPLDDQELYSTLEIALYKLQSDRRIRESRLWLKTTLECIGDGVIATDTQGKVVFMNVVAEALTGWRQTNAIGRSLGEVFDIVNEGTLAPIENPLTQILKERQVIGLAEPTLLVTKDGKKVPIANSGSPIRGDRGEIIGVVLVFRDQTNERMGRRIVDTRLGLIEYAISHTLDDLLKKALDDVGNLVDSPIGFYHFVSSDQKTLSLQQWSTPTPDGFCKGQGCGRHYSMDQAGVWADCVTAKKPVVHNGAASPPHKMGLPDKRAAVVRELVVPVMRDDKAVAILGVGNKPSGYTEKDVEIVSYLADVTWEVISQKRAEQELQKALLEWQATFDAVNAAIWIIDKDQRIIRTNDKAEHFFNKPYQELIGRHCWDVFHNVQHPLPQCPLPLARKSLHRETVEIELEKGWFEIAVDPIMDDVGGFAGAVQIVTDITKRKQSEREKEKLHDQLMQSQKMESVGRLAGGVAHDFNNMLSVIIGHAELAMQEAEPASGRHQDLTEIVNAAQRSADLTRQLLAFARKQTVNPRVLDINDTVSGMLKMLRRLIGEDIELLWKPGADLWPVRIDPAQIDQVLANLCVNGRDAIESVGKITIETKKATIDEAYCADHPGFTSGKYVMLAVSDDGHGIDQGIQNNIFEPFFTTKEAGRGTGLGLATVYGIVKQNNGFIDFYSEPGHGATFKIFLPRTQDIEIQPDEPVTASDLVGTETILLVEDETTILNLARKVLTNFGYTVLPAETVDEALDLAQRFANTIELIVTDVVMPKMDGPELKERVKQIIPNIKTLFMSGYTPDVIINHGIIEDDTYYLPKPFSVDGLGAKVREVLDIC